MITGWQWLAITIGMMFSCTIGLVAGIYIGIAVAGRTVRTLQYYTRMA